MEAEEDKIVEHVKEAVHSLTDKNKKWSAKIGSFIWEILVIVIAVNLTIWFHNWNDKRHERGLEKEFLVDIREDLMTDTAMIKNCINFYTNKPLVYYDSVMSQLNSNKINAEYIDSCSFQLTNNMIVGYNYAIYQSFSSAGNLRLIENRKLLGDIVSLYSMGFPGSEHRNLDLYSRRREGFDKYIGNKIGLTGKLSTIILQPEVQYLIQWSAIATEEMNKQNEELLNQVVAVINEIDQELKKI